MNKSVFCVVIYCHLQVGAMNFLFEYEVILADNFKRMLIICYWYKQLLICMLTLGLETKGQVKVH